MKYTSHKCHCKGHSKGQLWETRNWSLFLLKKTNELMNDSTPTPCPFILHHSSFQTLLEYKYISNYFKIYIYFELYILWTLEVSRSVRRSTLEGVKLPPLCLILHCWTQEQKLKRIINSSGTNSYLLCLSIRKIKNAPSTQNHNVLEYIN